MKTGLYCHIPFCGSTCDFCSFYQEKPARGDLDLYLEGMELEFSRLPKNLKFETIFWGGGTPSLLSAKDLSRLGESMLNNINNDFTEWSVEMAPSTVKKDKLKVLKDLGVTRFSLGVQSFDADLLKKLGRLHNPSQIYRAWELIESSEVKQTNIDLMFALPHQEIEQWESDLTEANRLNSSHISTYCLTFEEDTALYAKLAEGSLKIDAEKERLFYERGWDMLESFGFKQYEISNFSRSEKERCKHNVNTWEMNEWIGCGPSAASQFNHQRYKQTSSIKEWAEGLKENKNTFGEVSEVTETVRFIDRLIFGLRMNDGVSLSELKKRFSLPVFEKKLQRYFDQLMKEGYLNASEEKLVLTREGQLKCDAIGSRLLSLEA